MEFIHLLHLYKISLRTEFNDKNKNKTSQRIITIVASNVNFRNFIRIVISEIKKRKKVNIGKKKYDGFS